MKFFALSNFPDLAAKEIEELGGNVTNADVVIEFETSNIHNILFHSQSTRRIIAAVGKFPNFENIETFFPWADFFPKKCTFKVEVENVKGQDNRIAKAKKLTEYIMPILEKNDITCNINYQEN